MILKYKYFITEGTDGKGALLLEAAEMKLSDKVAKIKRALDLVAARIEEDGGIDIARRGVTGFVHYYTGPSVWT